VDPARKAALAALKIVRDGGYANLAVKQVLDRSQLTSRDAGFVTQLVYGVCRNMGTLDLIIEKASGRAITTLQPGVVDVLRLGTQQLLMMRVPAHAGVSACVCLASEQIGRHVSGVVNAILRRVAERDWDTWMDLITHGLPAAQAMAIRSCHPLWIEQVYAHCLPAGEVVQAMEANNEAPQPTLVVRPGLMTRDELLTYGGEPTPYSPWGVSRSGDPAQVPPVRDGRAAVQDEGSQLVADLLTRVDAPDGPWLDMCAGPGGKAALLTGLARDAGQGLVASELRPHRARLVASALRGYGSPAVVVADGCVPAWGSVFSRIMLDAPCTGLGALRRRAEARWRKTEDDLEGLVRLQCDLLWSACSSVVPGGVVAYVTCSPHPGETVEVIREAAKGLEILDAPALLGNVPNAQSELDPRFIQLWPHRHGTDAMFCALLRRTSVTELR